MRLIASTSILTLFMIISTTRALQCYDCYGTGPDHKECTQQRTCHGVACMIFDAGDNKTASAFCLLAMKGHKMEEAKDGCWLEPDGKGKHCMCFTDYCNKLHDRRNNDEVDPMAPLLPTAEFLKQNPLVDYDAPNLGDYVDDGAHPAPKHVLFPSADKQDMKTAGGSDDEDDLVAVGFEDYEQAEEKKRTKSTTTTTRSPSEGVVLPDDHNLSDEIEAEKELDAQEAARRPVSRVQENREIPTETSSSHYKPPSWVLFVFPMAASWARFWSGI